jgi:exportin-2 (importin alpha re-exporter)
MASDLQTVAQLLQATLDPRQHKQGKLSSTAARLLTFVADYLPIAEDALKLEQQKPGFSLLLLNIVASETFPPNTRLSGALCFKNFIKFNWVVGSSELAR